MEVFRRPSSFNSDRVSHFDGLSQTLHRISWRGQGLGGFFTARLSVVCCRTRGEELTVADALFPLVRVDERGADEASASVKS